MDQTLDRVLKQRLLGAVILAALLVILVPEWLDGAGHRSRYPKHIDIPEKPMFIPMTELMDKQTDLSSSQQDRTKVRKQSSIHAWALQVGSFSDKANAQVLRDKLRAKGHPTYVDMLKSSDKKTYRVRIGPELDRSRLKKLKGKMLKQEKIQAMIVKHP